MILTRLDGAIAYRIQSPLRAVSPVSGEVGARYGGRANRPGIRALYLALETETAIREYEQVSTLLPPGTLVGYEVTIERLVDLRAGYVADSGDPVWEDFTCDWRRLWFSERIAPPSWAIGDRLIQANVSGILFPSQIAPGGTNLVIFPDTLGAADTLRVSTPGRRLPAIRASDATMHPAQSCVVGSRHDRISDPQPHNRTEFFAEISAPVPETRAMSEQLPSQRLTALIRTLRKERGLSQETLAERAGLHRNSISLIERGESQPTVDTLFRLADGLGISAVELVERISSAK